MKLVEVIWRDANYYNLQHGKDDKFLVAKVSTVGYLFQDDRDSVILVMDRVDDGQFEDIRNIAVIPRENVVEIRELRKK